MGSVAQRDQALLHDDDGTVLMALRPLAARVSALNLCGARRELTDHVRTDSDGLSQLWGYFPELSPDPAAYSETVRLSRQIENRLLPQAVRRPDEVELALAFIRLALGEPVSSVGGMHIDVNAGVGHRWPDDVPTAWHVFRLLINLGSEPRRLEYCPIPIETLQRRYNVVASRLRYAVLDLPDDVPLRSVEIPGAGVDSLWCLRFVSSRVPHAGRTDGRGHFLASFGGYFPPGLLATICL